MSDVSAWATAGLRGEVVDDELAQVLRVGGGQPDEVVGRAREVEDRQHAGQVAHLRW